MPSVARTKTNDVDQFRLAVRPRNSNFMVTGRGEFDAEVTHVVLHRVWMQRAQESLPRIWHVEVTPDRITMSFLTAPGPTPTWRGSDVQDNQIIPFCPNSSGWHRLSGATRWGSISLPDAEFAKLSVAVAGRDLRPSRDVISMVPPWQALARLQRLHAAAGHLAETAPEIIESHDAARGLEQALVGAMFSCLDTEDIHEDTGARRHHSAILRRFRAAAETYAGEAMFLPEICAAIGIRERTLRVCCQEELGVSPARYLLLRRLHLAQQTLSAADPATQNVTEIATRYGFWELGRFSVYYKNVFGESPSTTLRRLPV